MKTFIPFLKFLKIRESLRNDMSFKKIIVSEELIQKYHSTSTAKDFKAKGVLFGVNNGLLLPGTTNLDIGAGKFKTVSKFLKKNGITNIMYDPFL